MSAEKRDLINQALIDFYQAESKVAPQLNEAILYSIKAGGKRLRPLLLLEVLSAFGLAPMPDYVQVATALEMIHIGSLIHDDLPAMDDDDYRRGRLTSHKVFGEATAILAGDSLFLDPFGLIAQTKLAAEVRVALIFELSQAAGSRGMVAGQVLDMLAEGKDSTLSQLQAIHAHKTGALLIYPFVAGAIIAEQPKEIVEKLRKIGALVGLAFQVRDDILDVTADFTALGKTPQKDLLAEKSTYPALLGLSTAYEFLETTLQQAQNQLDDLAQVTNFDAKVLKNMVESLRLHG